jgi:hypothetical protein
MNTAHNIPSAGAARAAATAPRSAFHLIRNSARVLAFAALALAAVSAALAQTGAGEVPAFTNPRTGDQLTGTVGTPLASDTSPGYQLAATGNPTSYGVAANSPGQLPAGLSLNAATGLITGTPTAARGHQIIFTATNAHGTGTVQVIFTIAPDPATQPPSFTNPRTGDQLTGTVGTPLASATGPGIQLTATGNPTSYGVSANSPGQLPAGLSLNAATGLITGTPTAARGHQIIFTATNANGTGTVQVIFTIAPAAAPVITNLPLPSGTALTGTVGAPFSFTINATNSPASFTVVTTGNGGAGGAGAGGGGLPAGLGLNRLTGAITGTPAVNGTFATAFIAANAAGSGAPVTQTFVIAPAPDTGTGAPPEITSPLAITGTAGKTISYQITTNASAGAGAVTYSTAAGAAPLPTGLNLGAATGLIGGAIARVGIYEIALVAAQNGRAGAATLTLTIVPDTTAGAPAYTAAPVAVPTAAPRALVSDAAGNLYLCDAENGVILRSAPAGTAPVPLLTGLNNPGGLALAGAGAATVLYIADTGNNRLLRLANPAAVSAPADALAEEIATALASPTGIAAASNGTLYLTNAADNTLWQLTPASAAPAPASASASAAAPVAGRAHSPSAPLAAPATLDGGLAETVLSQTASALVPSPAPASASYAAKLLAGAVSTPGSADGPGATARFDHPTALAYNEALSTLYLADTANSTIRQILITGTGAAATATVTTLAGSPGQAALADATGTAARLNTPEALVLDAAGLIYIADTGNNTLRVLDPVTRTLATIITPDLADPDADPALTLPASIALAPDGTVTIITAGADPDTSAVLTLAAAPAFITTPAPRTLAANTPVTLDATAWASPAPAYQWRKNGTAIATATTATYELSPAATASAGVATYTAAAANPAGTTTGTYQLTITATTPGTGGSSSSTGGGGGAPTTPALALLAALLVLRLRRK